MGLEAGAQALILTAENNKKRRHFRLVFMFFNRKISGISSNREGFMHFKRILLSLFFLLAVSAVRAPAQEANPVEKNPYQGLSTEALTQHYRTILNEVQQPGRLQDSAKKLKALLQASQHPELTANILYLLAFCQMRLSDYNSAIETTKTLVDKYSQTNLMKSGRVHKFLLKVIAKSAKPPTSWDYERYREGEDDAGNPVWRESVPPDKPVHRINFRLPFQMFAALQKIAPRMRETLQAKQLLEAMLSTPITVRWVDEKAVHTPWGHPADFFSKLTKKEKEHFSKIICERMFYEWKTEKIYMVLDMYDDVRNLKHYYTARSRPAEKKDAQPGFTLAQLFAAAAYDPYTDTFGSAVEASASEDFSF